MKQILAASQKAFRPDPRMDLVEWADKYLYLPRESTAEYGKYRSSRTPFCIEPLKNLSMTSNTSKVVVKKPTQLAATTMALIFLMGTADMWPGPTLMIMPTETLATSFSKKRIEPTLNATPRMKGKIKDRQGRESSNTILEKTFPGGSWRIAGSNSPVTYRSESIKYGVADDFDGFDLDIGGEGNPGDLLDRRTGTFTRHKIYINSTPTIKGLSNIEKEFELSSQGFFNVPCPICGKMQYLVFPRLKFDKVNLSWVYYECEHCGSQIDENQKSSMLPAGEYVHAFPDRNIKGFAYNALITPLGWRNTWHKIAQEWMAGYKDPQKRKVFANTILAEEYEEEGSRPAWEVISARAEPYRITEVPERALILSAGVDVQENRLVVVVLGFGRDEETWLILPDEIYGDPDQKKVWAELDEKILYRKWRHESGIDLTLVQMAVDSGYLPNSVYKYSRDRQNVISVKGQPGQGRPTLGRPSKQDVDYGGKIIKDGVLLWPVGDHTTKTTIYNRLSIKKESKDGPGVPGFIHFPIGLSDDFYQQLTAEKKVTRFVKGYPVEEWVKIGPRNDFLDAFKYAYAAAIRAGLNSVNWDQLEADLVLQTKKVKAEKEPKKWQEEQTVEREQPIQAIKNFRRPGWLNR